MWTDKQVSKLWDKHSIKMYMTKDQYSNNEDTLNQLSLDMNMNIFIYDIESSQCMLILGGHL